MKKTNKFLSVFLALIMIFSIIPMSSITASAQTIPTLTMTTDKTTVEVGEIVTVDVYLSEDSHISVLTVNLVYDTSAFDIVHMESYDIFGGAGIMKAKDENGIALYTAAIVDDVTEGGLLFSVELKAIKKSESTLYLDVVDCVYVDSNTMHVDTNAALVKVVNLITIQEPSRKTIRHMDGVVLHAFVEEYAHVDAFVRWTSNNDNFDREQTGNDLTIISENNGYTVFTAILYSADGKVLASDSIEMRSKAGFFDKIGGFFRSLFGAT